MARARRCSFFAWRPQVNRHWRRRSDVAWFGGRLTTAAEIANDPSLANQLVHDFRVTAGADILRVGDVRIHGGVHPYNNSFGTDVEPPNPLFLPVFPALGADRFLRRQAV